MMALPSPATPPRLAIGNDVDDALTNTPSAKAICSSPSTKQLVIYSKATESLQNRPYKQTPCVDSPTTFLNLPIEIVLKICNLVRRSYRRELEVANQLLSCHESQTSTAYAKSRKTRSQSSDMIYTVMSSFLRLRTARFTTMLLS